MSDATVIEALAADLVALLGNEAVLRDEVSRRAASRDYAWLSPILTEDLPSVIADIVVRPTRAADVGPVLAAAHRHRVPVTPRGRGTGNYGQAVPLQAGLVVDLSRCDRIVSIGSTPGGPVAEVEAGVTFNQLEVAANEHGFEVAVMPSTTNSSIGGFLAGGNQGVGSIEHGSIWDGWVLGLEVVGCRDDATSIQVEAADVASYIHSYGTAGVITSARLRLAQRRERTVLFAAFADFGAAARAGRELMDLDPPPRAIALDDPGLAASLPAHDGIVDDAVVFRTAVSVGTLDAASAIVAMHGGRVTAVDDAALTTLYASVYNHATLRAKRITPDICSLQVRGWALIERAAEVRAALPGVRLHLDGNAPVQHGKGYSGLLLSTWVDRVTLATGMERLRDLGVQVISPHTWVLGGHGNVERLQAVIPTVDPDGLLNPGKLPA